MDREALLDQLDEERLRRYLERVARPSLETRLLHFLEWIKNGGLSGHEQEKLMIHVDTEPQHFPYEPEAFILNKFDVFLRVKTGPNLDYLGQKLKIAGMTDLRSRLLKRCDELDFEALARDVEPFIFDRKDVKKVSIFPEFMESAIRTFRR